MCDVSAQGVAIIPFSKRKISINILYWKEIVKGNNNMKDEWRMFPLYMLFLFALNEWMLTRDFSGMMDFQVVVLSFTYYPKLDAVSKQYRFIKPHFSYPHWKYNPFILCLPVNTSRDVLNKEFCSTEPLLDKGNL